MKILSLKGTKRVREMKTSLEALKNIFKLAGGSARKADARSIESQNLRGENSEGKTSRALVKQEALRYAKAALSRESRVRNAGKAFEK